ncbi:MAG: glycine--tRNA ligase [Planctomycetes bacterium]|nr:glycine--tRNA ligase [Planctomycetota bacterium]
MEKLVSLCKRRGFMFQSSEIYGGLNGFWDYGPLGVELKRNVKEAWWRDMVSGHDDLTAASGAPSAHEMVGLDCTIIMHPQVWKCSGHYDLFHDYMVDCRTEGCKARFRSDHLSTSECPLKPSKHPGEHDKCRLTEPREFNLMFKTTIGALGGEDDVAFLRPETAQGIFVNFKNVLDSTRVKIPFGIAQVGKSFRNEITPRNFTFRSREFEQMEIEFFCHPDSSLEWYQYWRDRRMKWYVDLGLAGERLQLREHSPEERSHYSCGTADVEYAFPFLAEGEYGELEGVAHRGDFDLRSHMEGKLVKEYEPDGPLVLDVDEDGKAKWRGSGKDLTYRDEVTNERFTPHVIEPSAGLVIVMSGSRVSTVKVVERNVSLPAGSV